MALRLAEILLVESHGTEEFCRVAPLRVEDRGDMWFVTGDGDKGHNQPPDLVHDQLKNEIFYMHVAKKDSEVVNFGINVQMVLMPQVEAQIRAKLQLKNSESLPLFRDEFPKDLRNLFIEEMLHGGIINTNDAAIQFGELIFENHFPAKFRAAKNFRAELLDGIWHVTNRLEGQSVELVFRRSNAQVISLDLRPPK